MKAVFSRLRSLCAATIAAGLVLGVLPVRAGESSGLLGFEGPITGWLARAPASCAVSSVYRRLPPNHVAYWVGHAMDGDLRQLERMRGSKSQASWNGSTAGGIERVWALYDVQHHSAAFWIGKQDLDIWGAFADTPEPPATAPPMAAGLSELTLGGNVHLGDSLAVATSDLGLHTLAPTDAAPQCPGLSVVELCSWNASGCACPPTMDEYVRSVHVSGFIFFRNGRVAGFEWPEKCYAAG